jgi:hypothetical protein
VLSARLDTPRPRRATSWELVWVLVLSVEKRVDGTTRTVVSDHGSLSRGSVGIAGTS